MAVTTVGVRDLKARLSAHLRRVKRGETVTVTDNGRPVGRIVPIATTIESKLMALADAGMLEWSGGPLAVVTPSATVRGRHAVADLVIEDRP